MCDHRDANRTLSQLSYKPEYEVVWLRYVRLALPAELQAHNYPIIIHILRENARAFSGFFSLAPVYSVIALSRQAFCSYTFFIFSQRKDGENVAECYKTIEYPDRKAIAALYAAGAKAGQIAKEIGVAPRTIYAELKRGREGDKLDKNFRPSYDADLAQKRAQESLRRRGRRKGGPAE